MCRLAGPRRARAWRSCCATERLRKKSTLWRPGFFLPVTLPRGRKRACACALGASLTTAARAALVPRLAKAAAQLDRVPLDVVRSGSARARARAQRLTLCVVSLTAPQIPEIRGRFEDALRGEQPGSAKAEAFLRSVEHDLETYKHPDPYAFPVSTFTAMRHNSILTSGTVLRGRHEIPAQLASAGVCARRQDGRFPLN